MDPVDKAREAAKRFFGRSDVFAEVTNHLTRCRGKDLQLAPSDLCDLEGTPVMKNGRPFHVPEERDLMRLWQLKGGKSCIFALDLEYEPIYPTEIRYRDALTYYDELATVFKEWDFVSEIRKNNPDDGLRDGAYLMSKMLIHFPKGVKLVPVVSMTVYLGRKPWDTPQSIYEQMSHVPKALLEFESDYQMNVLDPHTITDEACRQFQTELRYVVPMLKYRSNLKALEAYFGGERPDALSPEAAALLRAHGYPNLAPEKG